MEDWEEPPEVYARELSSLEHSSSGEWRPVGRRGRVQDLGAALLQEEKAEER